MEIMFELIELVNGLDFTAVPGSSVRGGMPKMILTKTGAEKLIGFFKNAPVEEVAICHQT